MSYILEALKKAERERGISRLPTLTTVHDFHKVQRTRPAMVACGLIACAAVLLWFFRPTLSSIVRRPEAPAIVSPEQHLPENPPAAEPVADAQSPQDEAPPGEPQTRAKTGSSAPLPVPPRAAAQTSPQTQIGARRGAVAMQTPPDNGRSMIAPSDDADDAADEVAPKRSGSGEESPAPQARPTSLREAISKLTISLLMYADAEPDRKVYINGKKYVKGDLVEGRYLIESITQEGVVLSYAGERSLLRP